MVDTRPQYRIQVVSRMTEVPAPTLRAWERRYGIPNPQRTDSAYRLYSDADIEQVRRLRAYCEQGMAPSEAAALIAGQPDPLPVTTSAPDTPLHQELVEAVGSYDEAAFERLLARAFLSGSTVQVFDDVIAPTMQAIGDRWQRGLTTVAQEHLATAHLETCARSLLRLAQPAAPTYTVLLACCAGERHTLPLYGAALRFANWGFRVVVLGLSTPASAIADARIGIDVDLVGLSITNPVPVSEAGPLLSAYAEACGRTPWILGGAGAAPHLALTESLGGHVDPAEPGALRRLVDQLARGSSSTEY